MLPPIPSLPDYAISPTTGFLPDEPLLERLPDAYYAPWENIIAALQPLVLSRRLRDCVDRMPVLGTGRLCTTQEWRRAYSVLGFLAHGYIWGGDAPAERLPPSITIPLLETSTYLELPPVATYAGLVLWNFAPLFPLEHSLTLDNLRALTTFTGSLDEQWFYLVSVAIEAQGAPTIPLMLRAMRAARIGDSETVTECLAEFAETLDGIGTTLDRMYEHCDPHVFYHRIRPFLAGSKNMGEAGLPHGVFYDDGTETGSEWRQYGGGSNAQSPIIQFFDIVLGIEHFPTGTTASTTTSDIDETTTAPRPKNNFIEEMRTYMPGPYRRFLQHVHRISNIRDFVNAHRSDSDLCISFDACLAMLRALRDKHIRIVSRYIIVKSRESRSRSRSMSHHHHQSHSNSHNHNNHTSISPESPHSHSHSARKQIPQITNLARPQQPNPANPNISTSSATQAPKKPLRGTGGTALIPFLKQARDETGAPAVSAWAKRMMRGVGSLTVEEVDELRRLAGDDGEEGSVGMGGVWTDLGGEVGGICLY